MVFFMVVFLGQPAKRPQGEAGEATSVSPGAQATSVSQEAKMEPKAMVGVSVMMAIVGG